MKSLLISFVLLFCGTLTYAQTLFTIDGEPVSVDEFKRMYEKSQVNDSDKYTKESIDEYVDLFVKYKLKLRDAKEQGLDKDPEVLREIAQYEDQLIRNEFDRAVMNDLLNEAKNRLQEEVCMRHILIDVPGRYVGTADTIYSYNQALKVRNKLIAGEKFADLAKKNSRDMETKYIGGDLGCFTALQLANYQLENQAYKMRRGEISMPIRTHLGYHIIEVTDRRPSNGLVSATQLFVRSNNTLEEEEQVLAKEKIDSAYIKLIQKEEFEEVGTWLKSLEGIHASVDEVPQFMVGSYEKSFENGIFSIKEEGDFSRPVKTSLGWHIFRLNSRDPLPDFEDIEGNIRDKITEDDRYTNSRMKFGDELKSRYDFVKIDSVITNFKKDVASGISYTGWLLPTGFDYSQPFFTIEDRAYSAQQFVDFVKEQHELERYRSFDNYYNTFETNQLLNYHKHNLVKTDPEMKLLLQEYHDGIILFNMMEQETWRNLSTGDEEVKSYYENHQDDYRYPSEVLVKTYTVSNSKAANKLVDLLKSGKGEYSIRKLEKKNPIKRGEEQFLEEDATIYGQNLWNIGTLVKRVNSNGAYEILKSEQIVEGKVMPYNEVKAKVLVACQQELESNWANSLKSKYPIKLNKSVIESLIR